MQCLFARPWSTIHVLALAATSRVALLLVIVSSDALIRDYDLSASLWGTQPRRAGAWQGAQGDENGGSVEAFDIGLATWDSIHYGQIAVKGYEFEHSHAFFPLLPLMLRTALSAGASYESLIVYIGFSASNMAFILSAACLYKLTQLLYPDDDFMANITCVLYCLSPASIFFSAVYTESWFMLFSLTAMIALYKPMIDHPPRKGTAMACVQSTVSFFLASCLRSNGVLHAGHPVMAFLWSPWGWKGAVHATCQVWGAILPFVLFQGYGYATFCGVDESFGTKDWCQKTIPSLYSYIQRKYWNNGFLRFWSPKQAFNFLLGGPAICFSFLPTYQLAQRILHSGREWSSAVQSSILGNAKSYVIFVMNTQLIAMGLIALLFMHVQVATRFLACQPAFYWSCAGLISKCAEKTRGKKGSPKSLRSNLQIFLVFFYYLSFALVGAIAFINFLPFT